ncbi:type II toxin-antitoxin system PemK/MazF family toxin [Candidatus Woesearchaeota archaeon]|nr:MAG: hypothetical protein QS99_C0009G0033 [archaeon GW2011_AR4]MBS3129731.1 type II toxin-antitoxin system PemK/MazF family toxin [Candidatus Woesearchaeota archaeon]HIH37424.1 type II toxin-antitoxin system PemK/MazF family toxin [Candidatus Woesearchaeota archaeon]HIH48021.1 type II toxin-antitoxin system PemK/MazF family toxin [Candidatus Woesearchaeota archaeon]HIJ02887.1 type II toxin-antitoxin system PemK/MazF family toxin [Candidatus Woesearchaeota archaeon]
MKLYDIVLVDFPFSDLSQSKLRPALIVSLPGGDNLILCQITTKRRSISTYEIILDRSVCQGDIRFDGHIYVDMIFTLHKTLAQRNIGSINNPETKKVIRSKLISLFE